jgi:hypothetical protein
MLQRKPAPSSNITAAGSRRILQERSGNVTGSCRKAQERVRVGEGKRRVLHPHPQDDVYLISLAEELCTEELIIRRDR